MAHVVVLGAGLGGTIMAYELRDKLGEEHQVSVVSNGGTFFFVPSNPWVAVGWRDREGGRGRPRRRSLAARDIALHPEGAKRLHPTEHRIELNDGCIGRLRLSGHRHRTRSSLSTRSRGSGPRQTRNRSARSTTRCRPKPRVDALVANPGPVIIGAVQGASCFGPAYEFAFILDKALRDAKVRDRVPMTFVTSEPYIGHLGLDGVGDTKGLLESELRQHHIKWICNARVDKVEADRMLVSEIDEDGSVEAATSCPSPFAMMLPAFRGVAAVRGIEGLTNPRGFILDRQAPAQSGLPGDLRGRRLRGDPADRQDAGSGRRAEDRLHDRIDGDGDGPEHRAPDRRSGSRTRRRPGTPSASRISATRGIAFVAQPQIPPRNVNWSSSGKWVHAAKVGFEKYFLHKVRSGKSEPFYERLALQVLGIDKLKAIKVGTEPAP